MMYDLMSDTDKKDQLLELLEHILGPVRNHYASKSQIAFDCPECSGFKGVQYDGKGNLEINYSKGKFNCWACGEESGTHGSIFKLVKTWGTQEDLSQYKSLKLSFTYYNEDGEEIIYKAPVDFKLPPEFISLTTAPDIGNFRPYFNYLRERRITPDIIEKFNIGCCMEGKYANRVVLPSYNADGDLNYYVTRTIWKKKKKFKYMNAEVAKETIIFNEKFVDWDKAIFVVEGPFDHIVLPNSIPLLGKKMSDLMFRMLYDNAEKVILVLDPDAWDRTVQIYNKLDGGRLMGKIYATKMPDEIDVSKFNELYGQQALFDHIRRNTIKLID